jgi:hypothetical protein
MTSLSGAQTVRRLWRAQVSRAELTRIAMVGALPMVILVASPERVAYSVAISAAYLGLALIVVRPSAQSLPPLAYAVVAGSFMSATLISADPGRSDQYEYAVAKVGYFVVVVLPLGVAVALVVRRISDLKPAVVVFLAIGISLTIATLVLRSPTLLGAQRYAWQGNLLAVTALLLLQYWIVRNYWSATVLGVLAIVALTVANSRQSVAAIAAGLPLSLIYWLSAYVSATGAVRRAVISRRWITPLLFGLGWLAFLMIWLYLLQRRADGLPVPEFIADPKSCNCLMGRFMALLSTPGDRDQLLATAWQMFVQHPVFGAGPGSFLGRVTTYSYPHNVPMEIAAETGLVGITVLLVPLAVGFVRLALSGARAASPAVGSLLAILVVFAVVSNLSGDLPSARALWIFGLVALKLGFAPAQSVLDRDDPLSSATQAVPGQFTLAPIHGRRRLHGLPVSTAAVLGLTVVVLVGTIAGAGIALVGDRSVPRCDAAVFEASPARARVGAAVVFAPSASCGGEVAEFRWYVRIPGESGWALVQNWSTGDFVWNTAGLGAGVAGIDMYARRVGRPSSEIDVARDYVLDP